MAVPRFAKLKTLKPTKLQALLLLGGAFMVAAGFWTSTHYRLALDSTPQVPADSVLALRFLAKEPVSLADAKWQKIVSAFPVEAQEAIRVADQAQTLTVFAVPDQGGRLQWWTLEAMNSEPQGKPVWRLVSKDVDAVGFVQIGGRKQQLLATFGAEHAMFQVGRSYSGFFGAGPDKINERMNPAQNQDMLYLEKPEGASWGNAPSLLSLEMQRFQGLSAFWALPGRVELSISATGTDAVLQPFTLFYRPIGSIKTPRDVMENYAKGLLADALPQPVEVKLPDGSSMKELRNDPKSVKTSLKKNQFGEIVKYSYPNQKEDLSSVFMKSGEAWLTTDLNLVGAAYMSKLGSNIQKDDCHKGGAGGYAMIPASFLPFSSGFKAVTVTIHSLETGMLTICGYY